MDEAGLVEREVQMEREDTSCHPHPQPATKAGSPTLAMASERSTGPELLTHPNPFPAFYPVSRNPRVDTRAEGAAPIATIGLLMG